MLRNGLLQVGPSPACARRLLRQRRQQRGIQAVARQRPGQISAMPDMPRMQRVRALDVEFLEMRVVLLRRDVQALVRHHVPFIERIFARIAERYEFIIPFDIGKFEAGDQLHRPQRRVAPAQQRLAQLAQFALASARDRTRRPAH